MSWVKLDDKFADHPKVGELSDAAFRLHITALCWCARHETDGRVRKKSIKALPGYNPRAVSELVEAKLWSSPTEDAYEIKDYLKYNPSHEQLEAKRAATRERLKRYRDAEGDDDDSDDNASGNGVTGDVANAGCTTSPHPPSGLFVSGSDSSPEPTKPKDLTGYAREVFDFWAQETRHTRAKADKKRLARIKQRLREGFTVEQLKTAIRNRRHIPFLMGENSSGTVYDGIETLLRDAAQVEKLLAAGGPRPANDPASDPQTAARQAAHAAEIARRDEAQRRSLRERSDSTELSGVRDTASLTRNLFGGSGG